MPSGFFGPLNRLIPKDAAVFRIGHASIEGRFATIGRIAYSRPRYAFNLHSRPHYGSNGPKGPGSAPLKTKPFRPSSGQVMVPIAAKLSFRSQVCHNGYLVHFRFASFLDGSGGVRGATRSY